MVPGTSVFPSSATRMSGNFWGSIKGIETGPNEIIGDGVNGYLIEPGDHDKMVEKINYLISNVETRKTMSENVYETAHRFSVKEICKEWKVLLKELQSN